LRKVLQKLVKSTVEKLNQGEVNENSQKDKSEVLIDKLSKKEQTKPSNMSITSQIDQFKKGENWSSFATQLDAFIMLNDVPDTKKRALLLTRISTQVFSELKAACKENLLTMPYEDLKTKMQQLYEPVKNKCLARFAFRERTQKQNESISNFILALQSMAQQCNFAKNEVNKQIKDQLITGVNNKNIRYELLKESSKSLKELIEVAKMVDIADTKAAELNRGKTSEAAGFHRIDTSRNRRAGDSQAQTPNTQKE